MPDVTPSIGEQTPAQPELRPPFGSWKRVYLAVIAFFVVEVLFFAWLTWTFS